MESIVHFFSNLDQHPGLRLSMLTLGLLFFAFLEGWIPLFPLKYQTSKTRHAGVNLRFTALHLIIHTFLALLIIKLNDWCQMHHVGLSHWLQLNVLGTIFISVLILDFCGGWLVHFVQHKVPALWHIHIIHHADQHVDATTGLRHHPLESTLRGIFFMVGILISGAPMYAVMIFQTLLIFITAFTHANISLPPRIDQFLSFFLISPNMHKVHHHWKQPYTDSNYGAMFSIWDRMLGTFLILPKELIRYGIDRDYPEEKSQKIRTLLSYPFQRK